MNYENFFMKKPRSFFGREGKEYGHSSNEIEKIKAYKKKPSVGLGKSSRL